MRKIAIVLFAGVAAPAFAQDSLFNVGNLVVSQINGSTNASSAAVLREFTTAGIATGDNAFLPTVTFGAHRRVTVSGSATSEGHLNMTPDGSALVFQGYDSGTGVASIASTTSAVANRVVARIGMDLSIDSTTSLTDAYSGNNIRSAVMDGANVYTAGPSIAGGGGGVRNALFGATGTTTDVSATSFNARVVNIFNSTIYASSASTGAFGISSVSGGTSTLVIPTSPSGTGNPSSYDFLFLNPTTCYVTDDRTVANGGGLQKWTNSGSGWTLAYTLSAQLTAGLRSITLDPATGTFYAISADSQTKLVSVVDTGAGSTFTTLFTSASGTNMRGVEFITAPAPGTAMLLGLGGLVASRRRRS